MTSALTKPLAALPDPLPVEPAGGPIDASIRVPGSKSATNRAYVLAALAEGASVLERPLRSDDCDRLLASFETLGARVERRGDDVAITGVAGRFPSGGAIDLGDGGTPTRFAIAAATLASADVVVDGSRRMRERPVAEGVDFLRTLGASIDYAADDGRLPVRVHPVRPRGGALDVAPTASSQFVSALLLVAPWLEAGVALTYGRAVTSATYIDLTAAMLRDWGATVEGEAAPGATQVVRPGPLAARRTAIEPDASSAVYWAALAAMSPGAAIRLEGVARRGLQPDLGVFAALESAGATIEESGAALTVRGPARLRGFDVDAEGFPDGAMMLAVAAAVADGPSRIRGLRTLRVKESDRIAALATELERVGCRVESTDDELAVEPGASATSAVIETYRDHRMAMAFGVLGMVRGGIAVRDPRCVEKSYPGFWRDAAVLYTPAGASRDE